VFCCVHYLEIYYYYYFFNWNWADESADKLLNYLLFCCCCCCGCGGGGNARRYIALSRELHAMPVHEELKFDALFNKTLLESDFSTSASSRSVTGCVANPV